MRVLTGTQMREADRIAIEEYKIPGMDLMERAGEEAFRCVMDMLEAKSGGSGADSAKLNRRAKDMVLVLCGGGNNGGDGYVVARKLLKQRQPVVVMALSRPKSLKGDARTAYERFAAAGGRLAYSGGPGAINLLDLTLDSCDLVVDAILGTGIDRPVKDELHGVIDLINSSGKPVLAVDIPTGVGGDDGQIYGAAMKAVKTVTFQAAKTGCITAPGSGFCGELVVVDIGIPEEVLERVSRGL